MLAGLARLVHRHRRLVLGVWIALTVFGAFSASAVSKRWFESFSIPGYSAYESNQKALHTFGTGEQAPLVAVFHGSGDVTKNRGIPRALSKAQAANHGSRVSSYFSTGSNAYVSRDRHTTFAEIYPAGTPGFNSTAHEKETRAALKKAAPAGVSVQLTGRDPLQAASSGGGTGPSVFTEAIIGGLGAVIILLFVFGTVPAVAIPIAIAISSILNTFTLVWILTYVTNVSIIVQFLIALVGLGVAIDYALLMIFRFREELAQGEDVETALVETMTHAGRSVIISGSTVAIGLLSMIILPLPFIRSIGIGGMLIPAVSVLASITLLPALMSMLGPRINRLRVMPRRFVNPPSAEFGFWARWARLVTRRPLPVFLLGAIVVTLVVLPAFHMNPSDAELKNELAATGDATAGYSAVTKAGIPAGAFLPHIVLVEKGATPAVLAKTAEAVAKAPGIYGAAAPPSWRKDGVGLVEAFGTEDGSSRDAARTVSRLRHDVLPGIERELGGSTSVTLGGVPAESRDFISAVYGKFPYVLLFVLLLTFVLLMRAFRSVLLPLKAVLLNLISLGAAYGIVVFIFQDGHGSDLIWNVQATDAVISWIPLMIFAFLYGISMDYEVFMLTRMREAYDETGDTKRAIELGLARTGKLVTSAALVLMFAFFSLSTSPGPDIKQFAIGLSAGIIFDATVIRALLVPSVMQLMGRWNWWLPTWTAKVLRTRPSPLEPAASET